MNYCKIVYLTSQTFVVGSSNLVFLFKSVLIAQYITLRSRTTQNSDHLNYHFGLK